MPITPQDAQQALDNAERLYGEQEILAAMDRVAADITAQLKDKNPLLLCIMSGGLMPAAYLLARLRFPLQLDYIHASRYRGKTSGGELNWVVRPPAAIKGRTVLLIDDILDEGHTLAAIVAECRAMGAQDVLSVVALEKDLGRKKAIEATFRGLMVVNRYVFGFGMDYKEYWRNLLEVYAVKDND